jgi:hypothetical protein
MLFLLVVVDDDLACDALVCPMSCDHTRNLSIQVRNKTALLYLAVGVVSDAMNQLVFEFPIPTFQIVRVWQFVVVQCAARVQVRLEWTEVAFYWLRTFD